MNRLLELSSHIRSNSKTIAVASLAVLLADCNGHTPTGQVVAVVNNQEVTTQDLGAEARADGPAAASADPKLLLQKVIARILLAQDAHKRGLDRYPGYPSDIARLQQGFLAQKLVQTTVKPVTAPQPGQLSAFMDARPFMFKDRARLTLTEVQMPGADSVKTVQGIQSMSELISRLKALNVTYKQQDRTIDSAELPPPLAQKLASEPEGQLFFVQGPDVALAIIIKSRTPISVPPEEENKIATRLLTEVSGQQQVNAAVEKLKSSAKITYQPRFAPPAPGAKAPTPAAPSAADKG